MTFAISAGTNRENRHPRSVVSAVVFTSACINETTHLPRSGRPGSKARCSLSLCLPGLLCPLCLALSLISDKTVSIYRVSSRVRVFTLSSLVPLPPSSRTSPPAGSSMNNHAPRVPAPAAPAGLALSHGITEQEERGAARKRPNVLHSRTESSFTNTQALVSVTCRWDQFQVAVSLSLVCSRLSHSDRRINVTFSFRPVKRPTICARVSVFPNHFSISQSRGCTSARFA